MSGPRAPLSVRINDGTTDRHVTQYVRGLSFRKTAPGGFASASMQVKMPRSTFTDLGPNDPIYIYGPSGRTIWQGFADNPGTMDGPEGQGFDLSAMGTTVLASDESRSLMYVDKTFENFLRPEAVAASATTEAGVERPAGSSVGIGILLQFTPGQPIATSALAVMQYRLDLIGMQIGAIRVTTRSGVTDTGYRNQLAYHDGTSYTVLALQSSTTISTTAVTETKYAGTDMATTPQLIQIRLNRTGGATNITTDDIYSFFSDVSIAGRRMDRFGTLASGSSGMTTAAYVLASWVAEDLLGRVLTFADKGLSRVDTSSWQIDQLAYFDGAKASQVLDDLSLWEPDFLWEILHSTSAGYVFNYRAWPTTARYEISVSDGYNAPGADIDLCNRIAVFWTDERGNRRTTIRGASVPTLGNGSPVLADGSRDPAYTGRVRDADPITLPDGHGSLTNAQRIGDQVLAAKANPPKAATAVVKRRIRDMLTGSLVMPWEIEPGYLVRVRETGDLLRLTEMEYVDNDMTASLTLGEPQLTIEQRVARLSNKVA